MCVWEFANMEDQLGNCGKNLARSYVSGSMLHFEPCVRKVRNASIPGVKKNYRFGIKRRLPSSIDHPNLSNLMSKRALPNDVSLKTIHYGSEPLLEHVFWPKWVAKMNFPR